MVCFFVVVIAGVPLTTARMVIPVSGRGFGNAMTGISLGFRTFLSKLEDSRLRLVTLLNLGATPKKILLPLVD